MLDRDMTNVQVIGNDVDGYEIKRIDLNYHNSKRLGPKDPFATMEDAIEWCRQVQYKVRIMINTSRVEAL
jgi:hypothetical protein